MKQPKQALSVPLEKVEQKEVVDTLEAHGIECNAVPNEGSRGTSFPYGFVKGTPDLTLWNLAPDGKPVRVEMKRVDGEKKGPSEKQLEVHEALRAKGWHVIVGYGAKDAIKKLKDLGYAL